MIEPDETLASEIRALGRMEPPERNTKLRRGAETLRELPVDGLGVFLKEHGRAVAAVVAAGTLLNSPDRHSQTAVQWAQAVAKIYGSQISAMADPSFHPTRLWNFIAPLARTAGVES